ncbi:hypothetical protein H4R99_000669 [Coemansia sp. RSA 1722]|nr:hypothetical protein IWW45_000554 [Coemansia sp. RSA 485]KAJ2606116.1 hypothetical protein H4R99_000669 [Coemansia sp. RSA 1722]
MDASVDACPVAAGDTFTMLFREEDEDEWRAIENEHNGPITVYMAPAESKGEGAVWFKIYEQGFESSSDLWAINILNENDGHLDVTIPADIQAGDYLVRGEILALHLADQGTYEVYSNCALISVTGGGSSVPDGVDLESIYTDPDTYPGLLWNLYDEDNSNYPIPGPAVYEAGTSGPTNGKANSASSSNSSSVTEDDKMKSKTTGDNDPKKEDEVKEDEVKEDEVKEDEVKEDEVKEDEVKEDDPKKNDPSENKSQTPPTNKSNSNNSSNSSNEPCVNGKRRKLRRRRR